MRCPCNDKGLGELSGVHKDACPKRFKINEIVMSKHHTSMGIVTEITKEMVLVQFDWGTMPIMVDPGDLKFVERIIYTNNLVVGALGRV